MPDELMQTTRSFVTAYARKAGKSLIYLALVTEYLIWLSLWRLVRLTFSKSKTETNH